MKTFVQVVGLALYYVRITVFLVGVLALCIFTIQSLAWVQGAFAPGEEITIPVTNAVTGNAAYSWIVLLAVWLTLECVSAAVHGKQYIASIKGALKEVRDGLV